MAKAKDDDGSLKRLGGGRWQTRDARFTIEPQSGTWVVVDGEQRDDLGLPLVRGPFGSLNAAKAAIAAARSGGVPARVTPAPPTPRGKPAAPVVAKPPATAAKRQMAPARPAKPETPRDPAWFKNLEPTDRRRAQELIGRLKRAGVVDPEGVARRDIVGRVPAVAVLAIHRAMAALGPDAPPADVARRLASGHDAELDVRWRLVDGEGRPIGPESLDPPS